ncbi:ribonuclease H2, subunit B [Kalaharituber pfeilii]|nr:ribonuclease H2, subunit B [Kalaharituber pfeilii]
MPPRATRKSAKAAKARSAASSSDPSATDVNTTVDGASSSSPPQAAHPNAAIFIVPSAQASDPADLTVVALPHPATQAPTRYLLHSSLGLHEIKKITLPISVPRSWLVLPSPCENGGGKRSDGTESPMGAGQTVPDSSLYICTPIDPLFLLVGHLLSLSHFLPLDDILDPLIESSKHWGKILKANTKSEGLIKARIRSICDSVDAGGEMTYRINKNKLMKVLVEKCRRMVKGDSFPTSMEEEFVKKALTKPIGGESTLRLADEEKRNKKEEENEASEGTKDEIAPQPPTPKDSFADSQDSSLPKSISTLAINPFPEPNIPPEISHLMRLRISAQFLSSYLSSSVATELSSHLATVHDFTPLDNYIADIAKMKQELFVMRAGDYSIKRSIEEEGEAESKRKRKREEEEEEKKRKKNLSSGVKNLAKVNTKGMMKMTAFFKKKE